MAKTIRIQRKREKGWKMPENTISVTRPGKWGNPFKVGEPIWDPRSERMSLITPQSKTHCVELFRVYMESGLKKPDTWMTRDIHELSGKNLACWCKVGDPCHADVLIELSNHSQTS